MLFLGHNQRHFQRDSRLLLWSAQAVSRIIFQATGAVTAILVAPSDGKMNAIEPTRDDIAKVVRAAIR